MAETPEGRPSEIERLSLFDRNEFDFSTAIGFAERLLEERNTSDNIVVTTDRALQNISEQHPELDVIWSSHDSPVLRNRYLGLSNEQWTETEDHSFMFEVQSDKPSVYFDIDGTLGKWYADGRGYSSLEEIIDPANHYFRDIEPHEFMIQLAEELQNRGRDVCIISAADRDTIRDKMEWVHENLARNIVTDFFKDGDIHRVKLNDAEETELMSRISLMGNVENCEMYIENNNMYVDFVDRNEEPRMIPLAFTERNTLKDAVMTHEKIKEMRQPKAYTLPEGMYETIKEMPADAKVENVLDEIKNGNTSFLIDENKPLSELVAKADAEAVRKKNQNEISRD